ncbi:NADPH-dependent FMN reductase, partial [Candidatus Saccharibacteria bacterium 32-45-3]
MAKIAVIVGSLQTNSVNKALARNLEKLAPEGTEFDYLDISKFPLFNQDLESDFPAVVREQKEKLEGADGVLFVTPEYNRSFSGVIKNAIDWMSRPWGSNSFDGKPAGSVGATISPLGTGPAQAALRQVAVYLGMKVMGQPELY